MNKYIKTVLYVILLLSILMHWACPHKAIDPGLETASSSNLFSLPAPPTDGTIKFKPYMYRTAGTFQLSKYTLTGYSGAQVTYTYAGAQIQYEKMNNGSYKPRWVISGSKSAADVQARKNTIIISILPDYDTATSATTECNPYANITLDVNGFCTNILRDGKFGSASSVDFYSFEANLYAGCTRAGGGVCYKGNNFGNKPYDPGPGVGIGGYTYSLDSNNGVIGSGSSNEFKEYWYTDVATSSTSGKKFSVVLEYLDTSGNLYTSKFPFNGDLDNLSNNTPVWLRVGNFPDPSRTANIASYSVSANGAPGHSTQYIYTDYYQSGAAISGSTNRSNCTGLQGGSGTTRGAAVDPLSLANIDANDVISCNHVIPATDATIASSSVGNGSVYQDDDIIHKLQLAGKEFRAEGTTIDPRFEMLLIDIEFDVRRGEDRFITN